mmetsp:Transcript_32622/g.84247  ORF Transcript_32622/g.84247 Transcript_32622/m.84247 type:complete len:300 (-) Transcript_32622:41-940(-)
MAEAMLQFKKDVLEKLRRYRGEICQISNSGMFRNVYWQLKWGMSVKKKHGIIMMFPGDEGSSTTVDIFAHIDVFQYYGLKGENLFYRMSVGTDSDIFKDAQADRSSDIEGPMNEVRLSEDKVIYYLWTCFAAQKTKTPGHMYYNGQHVLLEKFFNDRMKDILTVGNDANLTDLKFLDPLLEELGVKAQRELDARVGVRDVAIDQYFREKFPELCYKERNATMQKVVVAAFLIVLLMNFGFGFPLLSKPTAPPLVACGIAGTTILLRRLSAFALRITKSKKPESTTYKVFSSLGRLLAKI